MSDGMHTPLASQRLRDWYAGGAHFEFGVFRIFYRRSDNWTEVALPAMVLVHGFPTSSFDWLPIWGGLSRHFRLLAPDLIGFGYSAKPRGHTYSIFEQADLIEALLKHHAVSDWHLLAHDYGDTVAQELLSRQNTTASSALKSLVLLNGGLFPETHRPRLIQRLLLSPLGPWLARRLDRRRFGRSLSAVFSAQRQPSENELDEYWSVVSHEDGQLLTPLLIRYMPERKRFRSRWVGALIDARIPVRLINGLADPISGAHMVVRYRELISNPDIVALPGVGHYPQIEAPDDVLRAVLERQT